MILAILIQVPSSPAQTPSPTPPMEAEPSPTLTPFTLPPSPELQPFEIDKKIEISVIDDPPRFNKRILRVKTRQIIVLTLRNATTPQDKRVVNWTLILPGSVDKVRALGLDATIRLDGALESPAVLAHTAFVRPGESTQLAFEAPERPGDYPFLSASETDEAPLSPGILRVEKIE